MKIEIELRCSVKHISCNDSWMQDENRVLAICECKSVCVNV